MRWLNDIAIRWKLVLVTALTSALALAVSGAIMAAYDARLSETQELSALQATAEVVAASTSASLVFNDVAATQEYLKALQANPVIEVAGAYDAGGLLVAEYRRAGSASAAPARASAPGRSSAGGELSVSVPVAEGSKTVGTVFLGAHTIPLSSRIARYGGITFLVMLGSLLLTVPLSLRLHAAISKPIREIAAAASRIAAGDLGVAVKRTSRADEIGVLVDKFADMVDSIRQMTQELKTGAEVLAETASEILATTSQVAASVAETAASVSQTSTTMEEVKQTVHMSADKARLVSEGAQRTAQAAKNGREAVQEVGQGMSHLREQVEAVAASILRLSERSQAIGEIIAAVNDLADQSNLLAVNAAIEAARAGEHGRGFAVVAQEVKSLADQSKQATAQVRTILGEIQKATSSAVLATEQGTKAVDLGVRQSARAGESINELTQILEAAAEAAVQIAASSQQQLAGVSQVAMAMDSIRQASSLNATGIRQAENAVKSVNQLGQKLATLAQKYQS
jgi:methyl-accepting chemotaxis protein